MYTGIGIFQWRRQKWYGMGMEDLLLMTTLFFLLRIQYVLEYTLPYRNGFGGRGVKLAIALANQTHCLRVSIRTLNAGIAGTCCFFLFVSNIKYHRAFLLSLA